MDIPNYVSFLSGDNLVSFWQMTKWFLFAVGSVIMIFIAVDVVTYLIQVLVAAFQDKDDDDDDDFDIYYR